LVYHLYTRNQAKLLKESREEYRIMNKTSQTPLPQMHIQSVKNNANRPALDGLLDGVLNRLEVYLFNPIHSLP